MYVSEARCTRWWQDVRLPSWPPRLQATYWAAGALPIGGICVVWASAHPGGVSGPRWGTTTPRRSAPGADRPPQYVPNTPPDPLKCIPDRFGDFHFDQNFRKSDPPPPRAALPGHPPLLGSPNRAPAGKVHFCHRSQIGPAISPQPGTLRSCYCAIREY